MRKILSIMLAGSVCSSAVWGGEPPKEVTPAIRTVMLGKCCPRPKESKFFEGFFILSKNSKVEISTPAKLSEKDAAVIKGVFSHYWKFCPSIEFKIGAACASLGDEGYSINIRDASFKIAGVNGIGVIQALKTLRQLAESEQGTQNFVFQSADIKDYASLKFRGIHICIFPETNIVSLEKYIRLAAYYKFNYVILEPWGTFPFKSHPEFCYADKALDRAAFKRLINLCYDLGITPIPQLSILGHASQSRGKSSKHAVLALHPELASLFEPLGWSYCMTNPKTENYLKDMISEIHEFYGNPPYFHIGCDEAFDMGTCYKCRQQNTADLFITHLNKFADFLKSRGARPIMWHDMLLDKKDKRWHLYVASGTKEMANALNRISKDIIIADWQYSYVEPKTVVWETPKYFKDAGFDVLVCPWENPVGISSLAKTARDEKLFGFLGTTWNYITGQRMCSALFYLTANAAWGGTSEADSLRIRTMAFNKHLVTIDNDTGIKEYELLGTQRQQIRDIGN